MLFVFLQSLYYTQHTGNSSRTAQCWVCCKTTTNLLECLISLNDVSGQNAWVYCWCQGDQTGNSLVSVDQMCQTPRSDMCSSRRNYIYIYIQGFSSQTVKYQWILNPRPVLYNCPKVLDHIENLWHMIYYFGLFKTSEKLNAKKFKIIISTDSHIVMLTVLYFI